MFDSQAQDISQRPLKAVSLGHLARESRMGLESPRAYLVPVLFWMAHGQGRFRIEDEVRGYTSHNAIYLPANTLHACEIGSRTQGSAVFFGGRDGLPRPSEVLHLRVTELQKQNELKQLVDGLRRESAAAGPLHEEILFHRAALTLLWLADEALKCGGTTARAEDMPRQMGLSRQGG